MKQVFVVVSIVILVGMFYFSINVSVMNKTLLHLSKKFNKRNFTIFNNEKSSEKKFKTKIFMKSKSKLSENCRRLFTTRHVDETLSSLLFGTNFDGAAKAGKAFLFMDYYKKKAQSIPSGLRSHLPKTQSRLRQVRGQSRLRQVRGQSRLRQVRGQSRLRQVRGQSRLRQVRCWLDKLFWCYFNPSMPRCT